MSGILGRLFGRKRSISARTKDEIARRYAERIGGQKVRDLGDAQVVSYEKDGAFDYDFYREVQNLANARKLNGQWVQEDQVARLAALVTEFVPKPRFGLCHGTRRGNEQKWFARHLPGECRVLGTEIADSATQFEDTVQWDFHEVNPDWVGKADFVYSNSWDHAYDPQKAFGAWIGSLKPGGVLLLDVSAGHRPEAVSAMDPFGASREALCALLADWFGDLGQVRGVRESGMHSGAAVETVVFQRGA